ncbi:MAG: hypothetical protein HY904_05675 [Deltaproteobacteria bacterium]|nr:hypothetical protein [Deltaproteobacteria bacterium]
MQQHGGRGAARWLVVAVGSLVVAGSVALALVVARLPFLAPWMPSPQFFKRALVVHVDLSILVWFYAFLAALFSMLPARSAVPRRGAAGPGIAVAGITLMIATALVPDVQPVLCNYVPALDHGAFLVGLAAFFGGVAWTLLDERLLPWREPPAPGGLVPDAAVPGLRTAALAFLLALLTVGGAASSLPAGLPAQGRFELLFWGGGHVLQIASVAAMLSVWLMLLTPALGRSPLPRRVAAALFGLLLLPALAAPVLALQGVQRGEVHEAFTQFMRWGIFPVVLAFLAACLQALLRAVRAGQVRMRDPRVLGFCASAALTVVGFLLGALIRGSTTMVPAHYHASIGAVTAGFMTITWPMLRALGAPVPSGRLQRLSVVQPLWFGAGQLVFALGFALAGAEGMARKAYGAEQHVRTALEWTGLVVMGAGGLVAITGGVLFLALFTLTVFRRRAASTFQPGSSPWVVVNIPSSH